MKNPGRGRDEKRGKREKEKGRRTEIERDRGGERKRESRVPKTRYSCSFPRINP